MTRARDLAKIANSNALTIDSSGNVGIGSTVPTSKLSVVGVVSASQVFASGVNITGVVTATSFSGSGANLTGVISGVGINTAGGSVGTGATILDFRGAGISTVTVSAGIATINITGGSSGGASVSISTVAPATPANGDLWFDNSDGNTYIYYTAQSVWVVSQTYGY